MRARGEAKLSILHWQREGVNRPSSGWMPPSRGMDAHSRPLPVIQRAGFFRCRSAKLRGSSTYRRMEVLHLGDRAIKSFFCQDQTERLLGVRGPCIEVLMSCVVGRMTLPSRCGNSELRLAASTDHFEPSTDHLTDRRTW